MKLDNVQYGNISCKIHRWNCLHFSTEHELVCVCVLRMVSNHWKAWRGAAEHTGTRSHRVSGGWRVWSAEENFQKVGSTAFGSHCCELQQILHCCVWKMMLYSSRSDCDSLTELLAIVEQSSQTSKHGCFVMHFEALRNTRFSKGLHFCALGTLYFLKLVETQFLKNMTRPLFSCCCSYDRYIVNVYMLNVQ